MDYNGNFLVSTILDPRVRLMNLPGCTNEMNADAKSYLRSEYKSDWSLGALTMARKKMEMAKVHAKDDEDDIEPENCSASTRAYTCSGIQKLGIVPIP